MKRHELTLDQKILFIKDSNAGNGLSVRKLAEKYSVFKSSAANIFMLTIVFFKLCSKVVFNELWEKLSWIHTSLRNEVEKGSETHFSNYRKDFREKKSKTSLKWTLWKGPLGVHYREVILYTVSIRVSYYLLDLVYNLKIISSM